MKSSRFNTTVDLGSGQSMMYNLLHRKYFVYPTADQYKLDHIMADLNRKTWDKDEVDYLVQVIQSKCAIQNTDNELDYIRYKENEQRFNDRVLTLMLLPTMGCNLNCTYCYQDNYSSSFTDETRDKIISFIKNYVKRVDAINLSWFGGEPSLEFDRVIEMTREIKQICDDNDVYLNVHVTTNGYLLTEDRVHQYVEAGVNAMQITIDGPKTIHDQRRIRFDGGGTYERIMSGIQWVVKNGIQLTYRMNVDPTNLKQVEEVMDYIEPQYRDNVIVSIGNLHQSKDNISFYSLYKLAIEKGYSYRRTKNSYAVCEVNYKHGYTIDPDGNILFCSFDMTDDKVIGKISSDGKPQITNRGAFYSRLHTSAVDNKACQNCTSLPICAGSCIMEQMRNNEKCLNNLSDGMSPQERALIHYYHDQREQVIQ